MSPKAERALRLARRVFVDDLGLKLFSLTIAIFLFALTHGTEEGRRSIYVDVVALLPARESGRILTTAPPARVRVILAGSQARLAALRAEQLPPIQLDLRELTAEEYRFSSRDLDLPAGVAVEQWSPPSIPLQFEPIAERVVPIRPSLQGELGPGLTIEATPELQPSEVKVIGPREAIAELEYVRLEATDLISLPEGVHRLKVGLRAPPEHSYYEGDAAVSVTLRVGKIQYERAFESLEVSVLGGSVRRLRPASVDLVLSGPKEVMDPVRARHLMPYIDLSELKPGAQLAPVRVRGIPEDVRILRILPSELMVTP